jgi:hypothetical protein
MRAWADYRIPVSERGGSIVIGFVQRFDSSDASSADGSIDPRSFVTNPGYETAPSTVTYYFAPRGDQRYDNVWRSDLALSWTMRLIGRTDAFFRGVVTNLFNQSAQIAGDETILTRTNNSAYQLFNPFTTTPVLGVHYDFGPNYLQPTGTGDYQTPREFSFSVGIRF